MSQIESSNQLFQQQTKNAAPFDKVGKGAWVSPLSIYHHKLTYDTFITLQYYSRMPLL
ncbi:TPA: hypothetical protein ACF1RY_000284 [Enterococcus hirae]|uniref:hypothetical protein n=1 Tax=Enterococcus hirae TaxID=1354 RepID=UPI0013B39861|nr:hypothetical protein [Enterococcus hirae]